MTTPTLEVAQAICAKNPALVQWIIENAGDNYKAIRNQVNRLSPTLKQKYNDNKFVTKADLHQLTWDIINVATGEADASEITIVL